MEFITKKHSKGKCPKCGSEKMVQTDVEREGIDHEFLIILYKCEECGLDFSERYRTIERYIESGYTPQTLKSEG